jgi:RNA polymerase sigma factor (TIGR02999 family)
MADAQDTETTQLLRAWAAGDRAALGRLTPRVYSELRRIAGHFMQNERPGGTIQTTALVHEAWLRMVDVTDVDWQHRAHFFAVSATMMRRILVDRARKRVTSKRGSGLPRVNLDEIPDVSSRNVRQIIALDDALKVLETMDPRKSRVVELRFFGGLTVEESAAVLKVSPDTIMRDWKLAGHGCSPSLTAAATRD